MNENETIKRNVMENGNDEEEGKRIFFLFFFFGMKKNLFVQIDVYVLVTHDDITQC